MKATFKKIQDASGRLVGKRVLLRIDTNVAIKDGRVLEDFRLRKVFPTINLLREQGARVILIGHLESEETTSLQPVFNYLKNYFPIVFAQSPLVVDDNVRKAVSDMKDGEVVLLENLRLNEGEKKNSPEFSALLASLADVYVNDAFSVSHRSHASVVGVPPLLPSYAGLLIQEEVAELSKCFAPAHPFLFILGGAKFETKLPLVQKFLDLADHVYIAGALANDCFKQKGLNVGLSVVADKPFDLGSIVQNPKTVLPSDVVVRKGADGSGEAGSTPDIFTKPATEVQGDEKILDAGRQSLEDLQKLIKQAKFILWNGPLGQYEAGFKEPTIKLAQMIAERTSDGIISVLGGGDTVAVISELSIENKFTFISSAGGAMLDFLVAETLVGIDALVQSTAVLA